MTRIFHLIFVFFLALSAYANEGREYGEANGYPAEWWVELDRSADWEILPQEAKAGEVVLSKRTELGIFSNFAATPFFLEGKYYESMEGFWQAMKYPEDKNDPRFDSRVVWPHTREEVEAMVGFAAKDAGKIASQNMKTLGIDWVSYKGRKMIYREKGNSAFYRVVLKGMKAKLTNTPGLKNLLKETRDLKLLPDHKVSKNAPKAWRYYEIWMDLRH